ncbi:Carnitine O-palmitoyltransferase 2, mitochondrial [Portunus trituberculatus]|uniref:Carnitine O-palmitoyltransferase 2, mitochondrial n=1 Tax=Portunus trituberculatus TaxID=210409 RepID=A0A5B7D228_PORTR|nr:Carnitine O-palmitoyltransferase 2, mitochondrial [Portunus trituberculatus]
MSDDYQYIHKSKIPTMHFQKSLLRLPIPALDKTCERYLRSQKVILSSEEYQRTEKFVTQFREGVGPTLQFQLKDIDKANKHTSYISGPWFDMYLSDRVPVVLNYNPFLGFHPEERPGLSDPVIRVTNTLVSSLRFMRTLRENVLEPVVYHLNPAKSDTLMFRRIARWTPSAISSYAAYAQKASAFPLDMSQFGSMFNSTRIPKLGKDILRADPKARHVLIMKNGHFYVFDVFDKDGNILSPEHIHACVSYIYNDQIPPAKRSIAIFTTENRDTWAKCREELVEAGNEATLDVLDTAAFNIVFDETVLGDDHEKMYHTFLHGDGNNRWFDKSFSLICTADGQLALNFEHSWGDGVAVVNYHTEVAKDIAKRPSVNSDSRPAPIDASQLVRRLGMLSLCEVLRFKDCRGWYHYGGAAYYFQNGESAATYESCSTSAFKHGRTETIRPATLETLAFCKAIAQAQPPNHSELKNLLNECSKMHGSLTKEAAMGQGFDRHLFALRKLAEASGSPMPDIFTDPAYAKINHIIISTSTLPSEEISFGGFAPVVSDGFGVGYIIRDDELGCTVSTYPPHCDGADFLECANKAYQIIKDVLTKE